jgi:hypothetical protein
MRTNPEMQIPWHQPVPGAGVLHRRGDLGVHQPKLGDGERKAAWERFSFPCGGTFE